MGMGFHRQTVVYIFNKGPITLTQPLSLLIIATHLLPISHGMWQPTTFNIVLVDYAHRLRQPESQETSHLSGILMRIQHCPMMPYGCWHHLLVYFIYGKLICSMFPQGNGIIWARHSRYPRGKPNKNRSNHSHDGSRPESYLLE